MKRTLTIAVVALALVVHAAPARADHDSWVTMGFGSTIGLARLSGSDGATQNAVMSEMNLRLRLLKVVGFDFNYNVAGEKSAGYGETFASNFRLSALLYLVPTSVMSVYLAGGAGGSTMGDMFSSELGNKSFHGGGGLEVYLGSHFALSAEFLMVIPEVSKVVISKNPLRVDGRSSVNLDTSGSPSPSDYISAENFQVSLGLKYYF